MKNNDELFENTTLLLGCFLTLLWPFVVIAIWTIIIVGVLSGLEFFGVDVPRYDGTPW